MATIEFTVGEGHFQDIARADFQLGERRVRVNYLSRGTNDGLPSLAIAIQKDDGSWFVWETTARMWNATAGAIRGAAAREGIEL